MDVILCVCVDEISVKTVNGLHELLVPMVSRQVVCRFTLQPYAHSLADLVRSMLDEDKAILHVHAENEGILCAHCCCTQRDGCTSRVITSMFDLLLCCSARVRLNGNRTLRTLDTSDPRIELS